MTVKTASSQIAQGDILFRRVDNLPADRKLTEIARENDLLVVGHSETGHHHAIGAADAKLLESDGGLVAYLSIESPYADVVHHRPYDTHQTVRLGKGLWEIRRQREHTPEGWRRVED